MEEEQKKQIENEFQQVQSKQFQQFNYFEEPPLDLEELEPEDKVWTLNPLQEAERIMVIH